METDSRFQVRQNERLVFSAPAVVEGLQPSLLAFEIATEGKAQRGTDLLHSHAGESGHTLTQPILRDSHRIVQVHRARRLHAVLFTKDDF
jgi:hypothetical protein